MHCRIDFDYRTEPKGYSQVVVQLPLGRPLRVPASLCCCKASRMVALTSGSALAQRMQSLNASQQASSDSAKELE